MGTCGFSRPQRFVVNYSYDLPFGTHTGLLGRVTKGRNISGVTLLQNGTPITIADSGAGTIYGTAGSANQARFTRRDVSRMIYGSIPTPGGVEARLGGNSGSQIYNTSAFAARDHRKRNGSGRLGSGILLRTTIQLGHVSIENSSNTRANHTIPAELLNSVNHPQFHQSERPRPGRRLSPARSDDTDRSTAPSQRPIRVIQFALKYILIV